MGDGPTDEDMRAAELALVNCLAVPPHHFGVPRNDGRWTTPYADFLDAIGLHDEARAERARVLGPPVP